MYVSISERRQRVALPILTASGIRPLERSDQTVRMLMPRRSATSLTVRRRSDMPFVVVNLGTRVVEGVRVLRAVLGECFFISITFLMCGSHRLAPVKAANYPM